eukprot:TRINITY_DN15667_c0_g1_i1.p1 TRINITY_DN15667_c0_g1~~TRINITY_DN15667_c0_g1_i1.p1  ORF type:complete len:189 (-),score=51.44 TRINITY_DN15667_c0_g1_i1:89-655(-)
MFFSGGPFAGQTFVTAVGVTTGSDKLTVRECGYGCITATAEGYGGGKALAANVLHSLPASGTTVRVTVDTNSTVEIETPVYRLLLSSPIKDVVWRNGVEDTPHVDAAAELLGKPTDPSGLLGDSADFWPRGGRPTPTGRCGPGRPMRSTGSLPPPAARAPYTAGAVRAAVGGEPPAAAARRDSEGAVA